LENAAAPQAASNAFQISGVDLPRNAQSLSVSAVQEVYFRTPDRTFYFFEEMGTKPTGDRGASSGQAGAALTSLKMTERGRTAWRSWARDSLGSAIPDEFLACTSRRFAVTALMSGGGGSALNASREPYEAGGRNDTQDRAGRRTYIRELVRDLSRREHERSRLCTNSLIAATNIVLPFDHIQCFVFVQIN